MSLLAELTDLRVASPMSVSLTLVSTETRLPSFSPPLRKLLLHSREIERLLGAVERKGMTLVPMSIYFNKTGRAKVELALAKGRQAKDKRDYIKDRDWKRDKARIMREQN